MGALPTIALLFLTAVAGVALLRREGLKTLLRGNRKLEVGELPAAEMFEGLILAVSGILLLVPGFITDIIALPGIIPWSRHWLVQRLLASPGFHAFAVRPGGRYRGDSGRVIEAEYWRDENKRD